MSVLQFYRTRVHVRLGLASLATTTDKIGDVDDGGWEEGGGSDGSGS